MKYRHHVETWLSVRMANFLKADGYDLTEPNSALHELVGTNAWKYHQYIGPKRRDEIAYALRMAKAHKLEALSQAVTLLEENGYTVTPPPK